MCLCAHASMNRHIYNINISSNLLNTYYVPDTILKHCYKHCHQSSQEPYDWVTDLFSKDGHNIFHHIYSSRILLSHQGMKSHSPLLEFCDYLGTNRIRWQWRCVAPEMRPEKVLYFLPCLLAHSLLKPSVTVSSPADLRPPYWEEAQASPDTETIEITGREGDVCPCSDMFQPPLF